MDAAGLRSSTALPPSAKWATFAGLYASLWATVVVLGFGNVAETIGTVLALPTAYSALSLAVPVPVIGAVVWWAVVERRRSYTYLRGGAVGALTALLTVAFWVLRLAIVYGAAAIRAGSVVVVPVLVVTVLAGFLGGLPLAYVRHTVS